MKRLKTGEHVTSPHMFAEFFAIMTGRGIPVLDAEGKTARLKLTGNDCARWLRSFKLDVKIVDLNAEEVLDGLGKAQVMNVQGGHVYDYLHALAAGKAKADELLTRNTDDFREFFRHVAWP